MWEIFCPQTNIIVRQDNDEAHQDYVFTQMGRRRLGK
jgi:hypothetical protein